MGEPPESARHTLHVYVHRLRRALGDERDRLAHHSSGYRLLVEDGELDAARFERLVTDGREALARNDHEGAAARLDEALRLWRGPPLNEFSDDPFAVDEAGRLEQLRLNALEDKMWAELGLGNHTEFVTELQELVSRHPLREVFWEQLMLALYRCGRQSDALRTFQAARSFLAEELGIDPGAALRTLESRILAQDPALVPHRPIVAAHTVAGLPQQRTTFVGRRVELEACSKLLSSSRLLTLFGPAGAGKTRLAIELARQGAAGFRDGVFFVPLATVTDVRLVDATIASALGLRDNPGVAAIEGVKAFLAARRSLLILDNFEHLLAASHEVGVLLDSAPDLTVLVTTRAPLQIGGEQLFPVPPLRSPPPARRTDPLAITRYDATSLFVSRARAADPGFKVDASNAADIAGIVDRVDGLPLAIELAAARVRVLPLRGLLALLEQRLPVLTNAPLDGEQRHRTMHDAIDWSYELIPGNEKSALRRLAVFVGGFTLDAAASVVQVDELTMLNMIDALLSHSLLYRPMTTGVPRYAMLELTREFALEHLEAAGEGHAARVAHLNYYCALAEDIEPKLSADPGGEGSRRLEAETANIQTALSFALAGGIPDGGLRLAAAVWRHWQSTERLSEGRHWLSELVQHPAAGPHERARGINALAGLAYWQADYDTAAGLYEELLDFYRSIGDQANEAETLYALSLTVMWEEKDLELGNRYSAQALELFQAIGSEQGLGRALMAQAGLHWWRHDYDEAHRLWVEALDLARSANDQATVLTMLAGLAAMKYQMGQAGTALELARSGLQDAREARNDHVAVWLLDLIASFSAREAPIAAVTLAAAAASLRERAGGGVLPEFLEIEGAEESASGLIERAAIDRARQVGTQLTFGEAVDLGHELAARQTIDRRASTPIWRGSTRSE